jgi:maleate isomerase
MHDKWKTAEHRWGVILPSSNTTMELELPAMSWDLDVSIHFDRVYLESVDEVSLQRMKNDLEQASRNLATAGTDALLLGCTSAGFVGSPDQARLLADRINGATGLPASTTALAVVDALSFLGVKEIFLVTPYTQEITDIEAGFLAAHGFKIAGSACLGITDNLEIGRYNETALNRFIERHYLPCEALFVSCTNLRSAFLVQSLESFLGVPVITSNTASVRTLMALTETPPSESMVQFGRMFRASD